MCRVIGISNATSFVASLPGTHQVLDFLITWGALGKDPISVGGVVQTMQHPGFDLL